MPELKNEKTKSIKKPRPHSIVFEDVSLTHHSQAYETDINNMVKGAVPWSIRQKSPFFIDETLLPDNYEELHNLIQSAQQQFMLLPPEIRARFQNDPAKLAQALGDPRRHQELVDLGLIQGEPTPTGGAGGQSPQAASNSSAATSSPAEPSTAPDTKHNPEKTKTK